MPLRMPENKKIFEAQGELEVRITPLIRQIRFTNFGPGILEVSLPERTLSISVLPDSSRILRSDGCTVYFLRTKTLTEYQVKEIR